MSALSFLSFTRDGNDSWSWTAHDAHGLRVGYQTGCLDMATAIENALTFLVPLEHEQNPPALPEPAPKATQAPGRRKQRK